MRRRGGHVGFTKDGDLYVADSVGRMVWSLAKEVEREREGNKSGGGEGQGREDDILLVSKRYISWCFVTVPALQYIGRAFDLSV